MDIFIVLTYSYLLGSIPFGLILVKFFKKKDVRNIGSGNIGATNVLRAGGKTLSFLTLFFDIIKGYFAVYLTNIYFNELIYFSAIIVFLSHIFPVWLKFKGGKGVATFIGTIIALNYYLGFIFILVWLLTYLVFKISSVSALISYLILTLTSLLFFEKNIFFFILFFLTISIYTHRQNILQIKNKFRHSF